MRAAAQPIGRGSTSTAMPRTYVIRQHSRDIAAWGSSKPWGCHQCHRYRTLSSLQNSCRSRIHTSQRQGGLARISLSSVSFFQHALGPRAVDLTIPSIQCSRVVLLGFGFDGFLDCSIINTSFVDIRILCASALEQILRGLLSSASPTADEAVSTR